MKSINNKLQGANLNHQPTQTKISSGYALLLSLSWNSKNRVILVGNVTKLSIREFFTFYLIRAGVSDIYRSIVILASSTTPL